MRYSFNNNLNNYKFIKEIGNQKSDIFNDGFGLIDYENLKLEQL